MNDTYMDLDDDIADLIKELENDPNIQIEVTDGFVSIKGMITNRQTFRKIKKLEAMIDGWMTNNTNSNEHTDSSDQCGPIETIEDETSVTIVFEVYQNNDLQDVRVTDTGVILHFNHFDKRLKFNSNLSSQIKKTFLNGIWSITCFKL